MYYGWSHDESRMQMMDLPDYLDSFRLGYERAVEDYGQQYSSLAGAYGAGVRPMGRKAERRGRKRDCGCGDHDRHHRHGDDCGCGGTMIGVWRGRGSSWG